MHFRRRSMLKPDAVGTPERRAGKTFRGLLLSAIIALGIIPKVSAQELRPLNDVLADLQGEPVRQMALF